MADTWLGLAGKVCVVTGGAGGLGRAIGAGFAAQGARVALLDLDGAAAAAAAVEIGGIGLGCDTSSEAAVRGAADDVAARLGAADVLVNNAGILRPGPLATLTLAEWNGMLAVNLTGYLLCAQAFGAAMLERRAGSLVHIASIAASFPQGQSGAYSPGKAAVAMLSRQLALEWGPMGVRTNSVSPGFLRTPLSEVHYANPDMLQLRTQVIPLRRLGTVDDIAAVVGFLASDAAGFINGEDIVADGGFLHTTLMHVHKHADQYGGTHQADLSPFARLNQQKT